MKSARRLARDHRACPQHREMIEAQITAENRWAEFKRTASGKLIPADALDRSRINGASAPEMKRADREFWAVLNDPDVAEMVGWGLPFTHRLPCGAIVDAELERAA